MSERKLSSRIRLAVVRPRPESTRPRRPFMHAWLASVGGALLVALSGWTVLTAAVIGSWMSAMAGSLAGASEISTRLWLLAHGLPVTFGPVRLSLVPLGASLLLALSLSWVAAFAARQASLARTPKVAEHLARQIALATAGSVTGTYTLVIAAACVANAGGPGIPRAVGGTLVVSGLASLTGAASGAGWRPLRRLPRWAVVVPRAIATAVGVMLAGGLLLLIVALVLRWSRVVALQQALGGGFVALLMVVLAHVAYLPNFILCAASWLTGAGFTLGTDSVVTMAGSKLGLLPGLPAFALVPDPGASRPWVIGWLAIPALAGASAAWVVVRSRRRARFDEAALVGGLSGSLAGLVLVAVCVLARGDLGSARLSGMGPQLRELAVLAPSVMGLAGLASGLVLGLLRPPGGDDDSDEAEETTRLRRR